MNQRERGQLVLAMRDAMIAVQFGVSRRDIPAAVSGLKKCLASAKHFFSGDAESLESFTGRLNEITRHVRARKFDKAMQTADHVFRQLQELCVLFAAGGNLDEFVEEMRVVDDEMTRLDFYVGQLCQTTFQDRGSPTKTIMFGMLDVLEHAFVGEFAEGDSPQSLIEEKAAQSPEAAAEIGVCVTLVEGILSEDMWAHLEKTARSGPVPRIVTLTTWLVKIIEKRHPRPEGPVMPGHYAVVANFMFTVGLLFAMSRRDLASELVAERRLA